MTTPTKTPATNAPGCGGEVSSRPWPDGVPPLLEGLCPDHFVVYALHGYGSKQRGGKPKWRSYRFFYEPLSAANKAEAQPRGVPRVVVSRRLQKIVYANAAARAIGIVPDGETQ